MGWNGTERDRTSSPPSHLGHTLRNGQRLMLLFNHRHTLSLSGTCLLGCLLYPFTPSERTEKPRKKVGSLLRFQDCPPHLSSDPLIHQSDGFSCSCPSSLLGSFLSSKSCLPLNHRPLYKPSGQTRSSFPRRFPLVQAAGWEPPAQASQQR